jgi:hypothetical protein
MIMELIRKQIETCGKSRYRISKDTGIDKAALCRIMQGGSCKAETIDLLLKYFGIELVQKKKVKKPLQTSVRVRSESRG